MECLEQKIDEVINLNQWQGFVSGKVVGGLAVLEALNIDKERRIEVFTVCLPPIRKRSMVDGSF